MHKWWHSAVVGKSMRQVLFSCLVLATEGGDINCDVWVQDKGVSTLLKEYMRGLNLSMGKRKRASSDTGGKHSRYSPADPVWAPTCVVPARPSPSNSPRSTDPASPMRSLSGRCRRKSQRLAEADDLDDEDFESESEEGQGSGDGSSVRPSAETRSGADAAADAAPRMLQVGPAGNGASDVRS